MQTVKYSVKTNEFAIIDKRGYVTTSFKPDNESWAKIRISLPYPVLLEILCVVLSVPLSHRYDSAGKKTYNRWLNI